MSKRCWNCYEKQLQATQIDYKATIKSQERTIQVEIPQLKIHVCRTCGARTFDNHAKQALKDAISHTK